jgi:hypothetical protein
MEQGRTYLAGGSCCRCNTERRARTDSCSSRHPAKHLQRHRKEAAKCKLCSTTNLYTTRTAEESKNTMSDAEDISREAIQTLLRTIEVSSQ